MPLCLFSKPLCRCAVSPMHYGVAAIVFSAYNEVMFSARLKNLHPYVPGEQPDDADYIKLNANENPYPPCPAVIDAITSLAGCSPEALARYPDPDATALRTEIALFLNRTGGALAQCTVQNGQCIPGAGHELPVPITPDMVYCGNGSDEVLSFLFYACFDAGHPLVTPQISYSFYPVYAGFYGVPLNTVPLTEDGTPDADALVQHANAADAPVLFANPNAPTGGALSRAAIRAMLLRTNRERVFVVDEAYADFAAESVLPLVAEFENLVVVRTFSKSMCGAGMRLGYMIAQPRVVAAITTVKNSVNHFPVDALTQAAGIAACRSDGYYADCAHKIVALRGRFAAFLNAHGWSVLPSHANFVFAKKDGMRGADVYRALKVSGILVRHFAVDGIEDYVRITIGTDEQMAAVEQAIARMD